METLSNTETQKQRLNYLISILLSETNYKIKIPENLNEKHYIYKSLCNMRSPNPLPKELKNICLWKGDITKLQIDAIVNAGNNEGLGCFVPKHVCIDNQIHSEAGTGLRLECYEYMKKIDRVLFDGEAMITNAYNLPCKKVIQTVGPCLDQNQENPNQLQVKSLGKCYVNSLKLLVQNNLSSIAFPAISTGLFGFPKLLAAKIAIGKIDEFISGLDNSYKDKIKVVINVYDDNNLKVYENVIIKEFYK